MNKQYIIFFLSFLLTVLMGCRKDSDITIDTPNNPLPQIEFNATIQGVVRDRQGLPLDRVQITLGSEMVETDLNGAFIISNKIQGQRALLELKKDGYFDLQKAVMASKKGFARTNIQLTALPPVSQINSSQGGTVEINGGGRVIFDSNTFIDEQGNRYDGVVYVYSFYIDPTDPMVDQFMPGDLTGFNSEDRLQALQSFGMAKVELRGNANQKIQIAESAQLELPVPGTLQGQAPSAIPLWHYDEELGFWKEEGEALLQGDIYIGSVSHFSFWNCDLPSEVVILEGIVERSDNSGLSSKILITRSSTGEERVGFSSTDGYFSGLVPANEELKLEVFDNCDLVVHTQTIAPLNADTDLGTISVNNNSNISSFTAGIIDCIAAPIAKTYLSITIPGSSREFLFFTNGQGNVSGTIETCGATEIVIRAYDLYNRLQSDPMTVTVSPNMDFGTLSPCSAPLVNTLTLEFDGRSHSMVFWGTFTPERIVLEGQTPGTAITTSVIVSDEINEITMAQYNVLVEFVKESSSPDVAYNLTALNLTEVVGDLPTYVIDDPVGNGELIENGLNPGDMIELKWEGVTVKEGQSGTVTGEFPNSTVTITTVLR